MIIYYKTGYHPETGEEWIHAALRDYAKRTESEKRRREKDADRFQILRTRRGKPYAAERPDISFSVTHTQDWWICAVGRTEDGPLGIDAEKKTRIVKRPAALARRFFHGEEAARVEKAAASVVEEDIGAGAANMENIGVYNAAVDDDGEGEKRAVSLFLNIWIRKEAYLKYTGEGLFGLSGDCTVTFGREPFGASGKEGISDGIAEDASAEFVSVDLDEKLYVVLCRRKSSGDKEFTLCRLT